MIILFILIIVFCAFSFVGFAFSPGGNDVETLIFSFVVGLVSVVIIGLIIIIKQLEGIQKDTSKNKEENNENSIKK